MAPLHCAVRTGSLDVTERSVVAVVTARSYL
jgi:hypothetical protein